MPTARKAKSNYTVIFEGGELDGKQTQYPCRSKPNPPWIDKSSWRKNPNWQQEPGAVGGVSANGQPRMLPTHNYYVAEKIVRRPVPSSTIKYVYKADFELSPSQVKEQLSFPPSPYL